MTLSTILSELYRRLGYATSPASEVTTRLTASINLAHRQLLSIPGLDSLRDFQVTFPSVASQSEYALANGVQKINGITDRTNDRQLQLRSLDWIRSVDPGLDTTGVPEYYALTGITAVAVQPSNASAIFVDSTSASDTNTAVIEGIRTGGYRAAASQTMTGTTAVQMGSLSDFVQVTKFYLSAAAVGTVTLHEDASGGTELAQIPIGSMFTRYFGIQLWPTPASAVTYYVDFTRTMPDMSNANDEPLLPEDFHWLLIESALIKEWTKKDDTRAADAKAAYDEGVGHLKYHVTCPPDYLPSRLQMQERSSRLGAWFPSRQW